MLGPFMTIARPIAAVFSAICAGLGVEIIKDAPAPTAESKPAGACCSHTPEPEPSCCSSTPAPAKPSAIARVIDGQRYAFTTLFMDIAKWLVIGVLAAAIAMTFIEPDQIASWGSGLPAMLLITLVGIPLYVCATASTPIALGLIHAGLSPGAALVFLISGPATNSAALTTLWKVLGRRAAILYLVTVAVTSLATGLAVDGLIGAGGLPESALVPAASSMAGQGVHAHHEGGDAVFWLETSCALVLLVVLINALRPRRRADGVDAMAMDDARVLELRVDGMHCNGCVTSVQRALSEVSGVTNAEVHLDEGRALIRGNGVSIQELVKAVQALGFEARS